MSRFQCGCVHADAKNTPAVRLGYEVGGYLKTACAIHSTPHEISGKTPDELWLETGRLGAKLANQDAVIVALTEQMRKSTAELSRAHTSFEELHSLCTEHGVPQGDIAWRLEVLLGCMSGLGTHPSDEAKDEAAEAGIYNVVTEAGSLWSIIAKYGVEPTSNPIELLSMHVIAVQEREDAYRRINRLSQALRQIHAIGQGSTTANSLQHLAQIAGDALGY